MIDAASRGGFNWAWSGPSIAGDSVLFMKRALTAGRLAGSSGRVLREVYRRRSTMRGHQGRLGCGGGGLMNQAIARWTSCAPDRRGR